MPRVLKYFKMKIYINGDSFTAGNGHGDYLIPGYPGLLKSPKSSNPIQKQWYETRANALQNDPTLALEVSVEEKTRCWGGVLQNLLRDTEVINRGVGGSSIDAILDRTLIDLSTIKDVDAVIIQLTVFTRIGFPAQDMSNCHTIHNVLLGMPPTNPDIHRWIIDNSSDISLAMRYVKVLATIKHAVISLTGKPPIIVDACSHVANSYIWTVPAVADLIRLLDITDCFPAKCKMSDFNYDGLSHFPCGHYGPDITNAFASMIANTYFCTCKKNAP